MDPGAGTAGRTGSDADLFGSSLAEHVSDFGARKMGVRSFLAPRVLARAARVNLRRRGVTRREATAVA